MADDLNERVQARLADFELIFALPADADKIFRYVDATPAGFLRILIPSWRERWERHRPRDESKPFDGITPRCWTCRSATGLPKYIEPDLCPDALSVLCEVGIEP